jgi:hypothetical protein
VAYKILFTEDALVDLDILLSFIRADNDVAGTLTIATMIWTFRYGHRMRLRAIARLGATQPVPGDGDPAVQTQ